MSIRENSSIVTPLFASDDDTAHFSFSNNNNDEEPYGKGARLSKRANSAKRTATGIVQPADIPNYAADDTTVHFALIDEDDPYIAIERLAKKLESAKKLAGEYRSKVDSMDDINKKLHSSIQQLQRDKKEAEQKAEESRAAILKKLDERSRQEDTSKRSKLQREWKKRHQRLLNVEEEEDEMEGLGAAPDSSMYWWERWLYRAQRWLRSIRRYVKTHGPLQQDVKYIEARFGTGISTYFIFFQFAVYSSIALFLLWTSLLFYHHILILRNEAADVKMTELVFGVPHSFLYSSFSSKEATAYAAVILFNALVMVIAVAVKQVHEHKFKKSVDILDRSNNTPVARVVFNCLDVSTASSHDFDNLRQSLAEQCRVALSEHKLKTEMAKRTRKQRTELLLRKAIGFSITILMIAVGWMVVIVLTIKKRTIADSLKGSPVSSLGDFIVPASMACINSLLPIIVSQTTELEKWDRPATALKVHMWRLYMCKILNVLVLMYSYFELRSGQWRVQDESAEDSTFTYCLESSPTSCVYCPEDQVAMKLLTTLAVNTFANYGFKIGWIFFQRVIMKERLVEFDLPNNLIDLILLCVLQWLTIPYLPALFLVDALLMYALFKLESFLLKRFMSKPKRPWSSRDTGAFLMYLIDATMAITLASFYYFMSVTGRTSCGPFASQTPFQSLSEWIATLGRGPEIALNVLTSPTLLWACVFILLVHLVMSHNATEVIEADGLDRQDILTRQLAMLDVNTKRLRKEVDYYKSLNNDRGEADGENE
mmetsp:Transcript_40755/g.66087  ORF Transcript_40755/g.66087 Transcript_40755/m.66087 type:complete len:768 (+) Transcript_40755:174-2477(+)|eukprot:CAMPEP_0184646730 /NCGR_PEP_ID=MMETSP0308-20130426/3482_1 /TAXON_ID=38269 /ORGANISM="Gloeochaete witrockiana, Strain SAG 46.84" /LENGTH=767 /DNA_ID=CAMNT_0027077019 /DNA_START=63 /DNA_END=2366 /DNA_ORIENTATION=+